MPWSQLMAARGGIERGRSYDSEDSCERARFDHSIRLALGKGGGITSRSLVASPIRTNGKKARVMANSRARQVVKFHARRISLLFQVTREVGIDTEYEVTLNVMNRRCQFCRSMKSHTSKSCQVQSKCLQS